MGVYKMRGTKDAVPLNHVLQASGALSSRPDGLALHLSLAPKGPCTEIVDILGSMYLNTEYFKIKVYAIWVHGPLG